MLRRSMPRVRRAAVLALGSVTLSLAVPTAAYADPIPSRPPMANPMALAALNEVQSYLYARLAAGDAVSRVLVDLESARAGFADAADGLTVVTDTYVTDEARRDLATVTGYLSARAAGGDLRAGTLAGALALPMAELDRAATYRAGLGADARTVGLHVQQFAPTPDLVDAARDVTELVDQTLVGSDRDLLAEAARQTQLLVDYANGLVGSDPLSTVHAQAARATERLDAYVDTALRHISELETELAGLRAQAEAAGQQVLTDIDAVLAAVGQLRDELRPIELQDLRDQVDAVLAYTVGQILGPDDPGPPDAAATLDVLRAELNAALGALIADGTIPECIDVTKAEQSAPTLPTPEHIVSDLQQIAAQNVPSDPEDADALTEVVGQTIKVSECVPAQAVLGTDADPTITLGTTTYNNFGTTLQDDSGGHDRSQPMLTNIVPEHLNDDTDYGGTIGKYDKTTNFGAVWYAYRGAYRDKRGTPYIVYQNGDATPGDTTRFTKAYSGIHQDMGPDMPFAAFSPQGERRVETNEGIPVTANFTVTTPKNKNGSSSSFSLSATKNFFVSHTKFGGGVLRANTDSGYIYATYGGHREIAKGYGDLTRVWGTAAAWFFPPRAGWWFTVWTEIHYKKK